MTGVRKIKCWAQVLGNCSNLQTKEHIVSKGILKEELSLNNIVLTYGIGTNDSNLKKVGVSSLSSKILCSRHNNQLSALDSEAIKAFTGLKNFLKISQNLKNGESLNQNNLEFNGLLLERWFLKTTINILYGPPHNCKTPPIELVELAFGLRKFPKEVGLCISAYQGGQWLNNDFDIKFLPILNKQGQYEFVFYEFAGWRFALPLTDSQIPQPNSLNLSSDYKPFENFINDISKSTLVYHLKKLSLEIGNINIMEIIFNW